ncbi:fasciclin domain-containing protein [Qipengyuania sp.]|uniref:fasciclin domain-containing protein n=1 Tax=Qipengyuania sp. TaxID=2004515 RepID=UPI0035C8520F
MTALMALGTVACSTQKQPNTVDRVIDNSRQTVASVVAGEQRFGKLAWALADTQLAPVLDGQGDYTLLAFEDAGFAKLGEKADQLSSVAERPLLAAILRAHILPGQVTPDSIRAAIARADGPVEMRTMAGDTVTFSQDGERLTVSNGPVTARIEPDAVAAVNGAVLPIDSVLMPG